MNKPKYYCFSDKKYNEDAYSFSSSHIMVLDGATGLSKKNYMSEDDAMWFVQMLKKEIEMHIKDPFSLSKIIDNAITEIQNLYSDIDSMDSIDLPNACISLFRFKEDKLEYFGLGDSVGIVQMKDGTIESFEDKKIYELDQSVIKHMLALSKEKQIPFLQTREETEIKEHLIRNRKLSNQFYYILDPSKKGISHAILKDWNLKDIYSNCCMSDGFSQILMYPEYSDFKQVLDAIERCEPIEKQLYEYQEMDSDCILFPRLKKRDDTTYIYLNFGL